ncbi:AmmeMemoRadiSam system radical SAM enzyme [Candidatus Marsarchaeota archaeon]|nr:AmmeMemoRadiSam system radical SAM enzyme [Candidatus Marsarchaeota archaeon]
MREGILYKQTAGKRAVCNICNRRCSLGDGQTGFCKVRKNVNGKICSTVYGKPYAVNVDPIEKKPLFHFNPGSKVLSIGTAGCSFNCQYCQNWDMSRAEAQEGEGETGNGISPSGIVRMAKEAGAQGISYTYNEPSVFLEYALDIARLAHKAGLFNTFVTNGYMTIEAAMETKGLIDAATIDFKASANRGFARKYISIPSEEPIFETILKLKKNNTFIEITDLIVPEVGDSIDDAKKLIIWIKNNIGNETPLHFLAFHPDYKMLDLPNTSRKTLEEHYLLAKSLGMKHVYVGNANAGHDDTHCANCNALLIKRNVFNVLMNNMIENICPKCGAEANIKV